MDVLFVNSIDFLYNVEPHVGQLILRDILKTSYNVDCINFDYLNRIGEISYSNDFDSNISLIGDYILNIQPKVIGFYTICNSFVYAIQIARYIKNKDNSIKIVLGGPHASATALDCMEYFDFVDIVVNGEAELIITKLIDALLGSEDLSCVPSILYRFDSEIKETSKSRLLTDSEICDYVVYEYYPLIESNKQIIEMEGGRGCPFQCTFCSTSVFWGNKFRIKPIENIISEMKYLNELYGVTSFSINHDMFTSNLEYLEKFCTAMMEQLPEISWHCSSRLDLLEKSSINMLINSNCKSIYIGIESGSTQMQKRIKKNMNLEKVMCNIKYLIEKKINITASFIYCYPTETIEEFYETVAIIEQLYISKINMIQLHKFMPLPLTEETNRINEKLIFNESMIESSICSSEFTNSLKEFITNYPAVFLQYYSTPTEVSEQYKFFDLFIRSLIQVDKIWGVILRYFTGKHGLLRLYSILEAGLSDLIKSYSSIEMFKKESNDSIILLFNEFYFRSIVKIKCKNQNSNEYFIEEELIRYAEIKYNYLTNKYQEAEIYRFSIDIEYYLDNNLVKEDLCYLKIENINGKVVSTNLTQFHNLINII